MAQVGRFRESRLDARASFKLSSRPVYGPLVLPRLVLPFRYVGWSGSQHLSNQPILSSKGRRPTTTAGAEFVQEHTAAHIRYS